MQSDENIVTEENILEYFDKLDQTDPRFFQQKLKEMRKALNSNKKKFNEILNDDEINIEQEHLDQLHSCLEKLFNIIDKLKNTTFMASSLPRIFEPKEIEDNINDCMNDINEALRKIGVDKPATFPTTSYQQDYIMIYDFFNDIIENVQNQKKKIKEILNQPTYNHNSIEKIIARYQNKMIPDDAINNIKCIKKYEIGDDIYEIGTLNDEQVTLTELSDNSNQYLDRILDVLTKVQHAEHDDVESLIGFYTKTENKKKEPTITIVTKRIGAELINFKLEKSDRTILAYKIAQAMAYIHSKNVIHRNLSTDSICVYREGKEIRCMIINFRSSRTLPKSSNAIMTHYRNIPNNCLKFLAPELYSGKNYDESVDVFSYGAILYYLAKGELPYTEKNVNQIKCALENKEMPSLDELNLDPELADLINKCWAFEPTERCTFNEILDYLVENKIIFPQDKENEDDNNETINKFYEEANQNIKNTIVKDCITILDNIIKTIPKSYQLFNQLFSTKYFLQSFRNHLFNYQPNNNDESKLNNLKSKLKSFEDLLPVTLTEKWIPEPGLDFDDLKTSCNQIEISKISQDIVSIMNDIDNTIRKLKYSSSECYKQSKSDLFYDFKKYLAFYKDNSHFSKEEYMKKKKEIKKYLETNNLLSLWNEINNRPSIRTYNTIYERFESLKSPQTIYFKKMLNFTDLSKGIERTGLSKILYKSKNTFVYTDVYNKDNIKNTKVAIKAISGEFLGSDEENINKLAKEIDFNLIIEHKYIAKCYGYLIDKDSCNVYLITELGSSGTLQDLINNKRLSGDKKTYIAVKLAEVMTYLRDVKEIAHHDLTTSNIVIENGDPKLIDFGHASIGVKNFNNVTNDTPNNVNLDNEDDIFSFSRILYEMLTGTKLQENVRNFKFNKDEDKKTKLEKLIEFGFQTEEYRTFTKIFNRMLGSNVSYPDADEVNITNFYEKTKSEYYKELFPDKFIKISES